MQKKGYLAHSVSAALLITSVQSFAGNAAQSTSDSGKSASLSVVARISGPKGELLVKRSENPDGNIVLISNKTDAPIYIANPLGLDSDIEPDRPMSWGCSSEDPIMTYSLETEDGTHLFNAPVHCGDVISVVSEQE